MSRRTRTAALLSTATLLTGAAFALALAPSAAADIPTPPLGTLTVDSTSPVAGDTVHISGTGCLTLSTPVTKPSTAATAADAGAAGAGATDAAGSDPAASSPAAPAAPEPGSVTVTVTGPDSFSSGTTGTASPDGSWDGAGGIILGDAGSYSVDATCTLTDPLLGQQATFDYDTVTFDVAAAPVVVDPRVTCSAPSQTCDTTHPGDTVSIGGTGFPVNTTATIALAGYASQTAAVDDQGGFAPVTFVIRADQSAGVLRGTVSADGADASFSVTVVSADDTTVDGPVPGDTDPGDTGGTGVTGTDVPVDTSEVGVASTTPTLPNTGTDSLWAGVIGGLLVLSGGGLLWVSRRRDDADATAA